MIVLVVEHYQGLKYRSRRGEEPEAVNENDKKTEEDF